MSTGNIPLTPAMKAGGLSPRQDSAETIIRDLQRTIRAIQQAMPKSFVQAVPIAMTVSSPWTITHGFGRVVGVQVIDQYVNPSNPGQLITMAQSGANFHQVLPAGVDLLNPYLIVHTVDPNTVQVWINTDVVPTGNWTFTGTAVIT